MILRRTWTGQARRVEAIRIAQVCPRYSPSIGGVETHVQAISETLVRQGHQVDVLTTDPSGKLEREASINDVIVKRFKSWAPNESYFISPKLERFLSKNAQLYDVIHAHSYHAFPAFHVARAVNRYYLTPHYHGRGHTLVRSLLHIPYKPLARKLVRNAVRIFCVSNYEKSLLKTNFDLDESKLVLIGNGIDPDEFRDSSHRVKNDKTILSVGRLEGYKGFDHLTRVLTDELLSDFQLEIVGEGPYGTKLTELAESLRVQDRVSFTSRIERPKLLQKYSNAGVFCLLSKYEASGIVVLESLASGTPCIVANRSALTEWVDGRNCFGIQLQSELPELPQLIRAVAGRHVENLSLPTWHDVTRKLIEAYSAPTSA